MDEVPTDDKTSAPDGGTARAARAMRDFSAEAAAEISDAATKATRQLRDSASSLADEAREQFRELLRAEMGAGVDLADEAIAAARTFADTLDENAPHAASFVRAAADRADVASSRARNLDPEDLYAAAADFAQRRPAAFLGAAAALGFVVARFLKAAAPAAQAERPEAALMDDAHDA